MSGYINNNQILLTTSDTLNEHLLDNLHMVLRIRHHLRNGSSPNEAMNRTYQDIVVPPNVLANYGNGGNRRESFDVMEILQGIGTAAFNKCKSDFGSCVDIAGKVYSTTKCLTTGGGISGAIVVGVKGGGCPAGTTKAPAAATPAAAAAAAAQIDELASATTETCNRTPSTYKDKDGNFIPYFSSTSHPVSSWDQPYSWTPPVNCGCWQSGNYSWVAPTATADGKWVTPSTCGK